MMLQFHQRWPKGRAPKPGVHILTPAAHIPILPATDTVANSELSLQAVELLRENISVPDPWA
jgi:hypothetical protein